MTLTDDQIADLESADLLTRTAKAIYDNARASRERLIRNIAEEGGTYREIAGHSGVAYQRVAQIVTGDDPPHRTRDDELNFECPRCGAAVGERCEGKGYGQMHIQRAHLAIAAFKEEHPEVG